MTGTSMSTPHVSGLVALMLEAGDCLVGDYATVGGLIMQTARPIAYATGGTPSPGPGNVPNYATGWGEIDAAAAVDAAADACGPTGFVAGTVRGADGAPIAHARIEFLPAGSAGDAISGADGHYVRRVPSNVDSLNVRVTAYGYLPYTEHGVLVTTGATTTLDVVLPTAPTHKLGGVVRDARTGWPLHARITVAGSPLAPLWTDPLTGAFSVRLPEGGQYRLDVMDGITGYRPASRELGPFVGGRSEVLDLEADAATCRAPATRTRAPPCRRTSRQAGCRPAGAGPARASAGSSAAARSFRVPISRFRNMGSSPRPTTNSAMAAAGPTTHASTTS
jgi:hypothetical protein